MSTQQSTATPVHAEEDVRDLIREIILELAPNGDAAGDADARLIEDLEFHSLALLELAFTLEDEYDLTPIDEEAARKITTIAEVESHVVNELRERGELA